MTAEEIRAIAQNAMREAIAAKNEDDRMEKLESAVNGILEKLKDGESANSKAKNEAYEGKETKEEEAAEKKAEEKEGDTVENAKPSQALVAAFSTALNIDFGTKTPSFADLAKLSGIVETDPFARITAVNAKYAELTAVTAKNTVPNVSSKEVF
jgi:hypothetical protein